MTLSSSNDKYRSLFEQAFDGLHITDFKGNFTDVNSSFSNMLGYSKEELLRMNVSSLIDPEQLKERPIAFDRLSAGEHVFSERRMLHKKGHVVEVEASVRKLGEKNRILAIARDVTARKELERRLLNQKVEQQRKITRAVLKAQEIQRNKIGQELHDNVNQILASAKLYLNFIGKDTGVPETDLVQKTKDLIDFAVEEIRLLSREHVLPQKELDLRSLIQSLANCLNEGSSMKANFTYHQEAQPIPEDLKLNTYRIIQEQINNILKHASATQLDISVTIRKGRIQVTVLDNGKGFHPDKARRGLGISNMINRVESFNGEMQIESSPGAGCQLKFELPL